MNMESIDRQVKALKKVTEAFSELGLSQVEGLLVLASLVTGVYQMRVHGQKKDPVETEKIISALFSIEVIKKAPVIAQEKLEEIMKETFPENDVIVVDNNPRTETIN